MSNASELFGTMLDEQPEEATPDSGPRFPHLTWKYGNRELANMVPDPSALSTVQYHGGWFLAEDTVNAFGIDEEELAELGWQADKFTTRQGTVEGFSAKTIDVRILYMRRRWLKKGDERGAVTWGEGFDLREQGVGLRSHMQVLVLVKGLESYGPFILTMKGSAQMAFSSAGMWRGSGILDTVRSTLLASANKLAARKGKGFHYMAVYAPVGVEFVEKGKGKKKEVAPNFIEMGRGDDTTFLVVPTVVWPADVEPGHEMSADELSPFFQPQDTYSQAIELYKDAETKSWAEEWDNAETVDGEHHEEPAAVEDEAEEEEEPATPFDDDDLDL